MKNWVGMVLVGLAAVTVQAAEILVSLESNGVLLVEGMEPGTDCAIEWAARLDGGFTNNPAPFAGLVADSNGVVQIDIPMFFRVKGIAEGTIPDGMVKIPVGVNSGTDPDFGPYSLTNEFVFYMDSKEVTQELWDTVYDWAETNGYDFSGAKLSKGPDHPVHSVSWYDCVKWCNARSEMDGKPPCYTVDGGTYRSGDREPDCDLDVSGYRLPTGDEWQYAARGGASGLRFPWGDTITHSEANYDADSSSYSYDTSPTQGTHPIYNEGDRPQTNPVDAFSANGYGLYNIVGNVCEWSTEWHPDHIDSRRMLLGGAWNNPADFARCGRPNRQFPVATTDQQGFRTILPFK